MDRRLLATIVTPAAFQVTPEQPSNDESWASLAVFTQLALLAISFIAGHILERNRVSWLGEAGCALLLGVGVGMGVKFFAVSETFAKWISFKKEFFFIALLPPIIFDAGFSLKTKPFFSNFGAIALYAFAGTAISTFVVGYIVWLGGWLGICAPLTFLEATLFGAIVSATDPVSVLAVFTRLHVKEQLYALVFGESVLNDAVAIVMYSTLTIFLDKPVSAGACLTALGTFLAIFLGSCIVGIAFALLASWLVKSKYFRSDHLPLESCLVVLFAYSSYMLADGLGLSGIVAILFCGMVMAHFTRPNLSKVSRDRTAAFTKMLATLSETFVFIYIGASLFLEDQAWDKGLTWAFLGVSLVSLAVSRALNVYPCTAMINAVRSPECRIPSGHTFMLWFSGLRGAMAFALSLQAAADLPDSAGRVILTSTFFIVLITVLINGGSSSYLIEKLGLQSDAGVPHFNLHGPPGGYHTVPLAEDHDSPAALSMQGSPHHGSAPAAVVWDYAESGRGSPPPGSGADDGSNHGSNRARSPPSGSGFLAQSLSRVRELNREGFVLEKLHRLDERLSLSKMFMPTQMSEDLEAELAHMNRPHMGPHSVHAAAGRAGHQSPPPPPQPPQQQQQQQVAADFSTPGAQAVVSRRQSSTDMDMRLP